MAALPHNAAKTGTPKDRKLPVPSALAKKVSFAFEDSVAQSVDRRESIAQVFFRSLFTLPVYRCYIHQQKLKLSVGQTREAKTPVDCIRRRRI